MLGVLPLVVVWIGAKAWSSTRKLASRPTRGCERLIDDRSPFSGWEGQLNSPRPFDSARATQQMMATRHETLSESVSRRSALRGRSQSVHAKPNKVSDLREIE